VTLETHAVAPAPERLTDVSPLVFDRASQSVYIGYSLGRGRHDEVYNLIQRRGSLTPHLAHEAHGYYLPDRSFDWYEYFYVPSALEEQELRSAIEGRAVEDGGARRLVLGARRHLRPLRAQARRATALVSEVERFFRPPRPPVDPPERVADLSQVEPYDAFITPNGLASRCRYVLNLDVLSVNQEAENDWWFCKSEWLEYFFRELAPSSPFVLVASNSDRAIGRRFARYLSRPELVAWFAVNVAFEHPKLLAVPLGLGDPCEQYGHAGGDVLEAQGKRLPKRRLFDVSFNVKTNPEERLRCLAETGLTLDAPLSKPEYLERLASSYFCVAPSGNGIDTHRVWEALYLRTVPVVTRSVLTDQHPDLPLVVVGDWSEFRSIDFSPELYASTLGDWEPAELGLDRCLTRMARAVERLRGSGELAEEPSQP
jgi:hypothetical protein